MCLRLHIGSLEVVGDERQITLIDIFGQRLDTPNDFPTLGCLASTRMFQPPTWFLFGNRIIETEFFTPTNVSHSNEQQGPSDPDIRPTGVVDMTRWNPWINPRIVSNSYHILILLHLLLRLLDHLSSFPFQNEDDLSLLQILGCKDTLPINF